MHQSTPTTKSTDVDRSQPLFTGMAQGQRAGLITPRSLDRNGLPVFSNSSALQKQSVIARATKNMSSFTGVAQRKRAVKHRLLPFDYFGGLT